MLHKQLNARQKKSLWTTVVLAAAMVLAVVTWLPSWEKVGQPGSDVAARAASEREIPTASPAASSPSATTAPLVPTTRTAKPPQETTPLPSPSPETEETFFQKLFKKESVAATNPKDVVLEPLVLMDNKNARITVPTLHGYGDPALEQKVNETIEKRLGVGELVATAEKLANGSSNNGRWEVYLKYTGERVGQTYHIQGDSYVYSGGASGECKQHHLYIDAVTGQFYALDDLFNNPKSARAFLEQEINAILQQNPECFLEKAQAAPLPENFYLEDHKLILVYPMYSIAPRASGFPEFEIDLSRLEPNLNKEGTFWKALVTKIN